MAEGQVPQRGIPLDQPLLSAGKYHVSEATWMCITQVKKAACKIHMEFFSHTVFYEFHVKMNLYEIYMTNST